MRSFDKTKGVKIETNIRGIIGIIIGIIIGGIIGRIIGGILEETIGGILGAMSGEWLEAKIRGVGRINGLRDDQKQGDSKADQKPDGSKENQKPGGSKDDQKPGGSKDDQKPDAPNTNETRWSRETIGEIIGVTIGTILGVIVGGPLVAIVGEKIGVTIGVIEVTIGITIGITIGATIGAVIVDQIEHKETPKDILIATISTMLFAFGGIGLLVFAVIVVSNILIQDGVKLKNIEKVVQGVPPESIKWLLVFTTIFVLGWNLVRARKKKEEQEWQKKYFGKYNDVLKRTQLNLESMREFYTWTQKQARMAFRLAVGMCIAGIALICVAIRISNNDMTIISTIGGVVTELIAGTALIVYRRSLSQLNYYHKALHQDQRILLGIEQLDKFGNSDKANSDKTDNDKTSDIIRDEMRKALIQGLIDMNLAEVAQPEKEKADKNKSDT